MRYQFDELRDAALSPDATQNDINALGEWFQRYGYSDWNGEYFDVDGVNRLRPVYIEAEDGDFITSGYELY